MALRGRTEPHRPPRECGRTASPPRRSKRDPMPPSHPTAAELSPIRAAPLPPTPFPHPTGSAERSAPTAAPQTPPPTPTPPHPPPIPPASNCCHVGSITGASCPDSCCAGAHPCMGSHLGSFGRFSPIDGGFFYGRGGGGEQCRRRAFRPSTERGADRPPPPSLPPLSLRGPSDEAPIHADRLPHQLLPVQPLHGRLRLFVRLVLHQRVSLWGDAEQ